MMSKQSSYRNARFRFTLRTLLAVTFCLLVCSSWFGWELRFRSARKQAWRELRSTEFHVTDFSPTKSWFGGRDRRQFISTTGQCIATDEHIRLARNCFPELEGLALGQSIVSSETLQCFRNSRLSTLIIIDSPNITDNVMYTVGGLPRIAYLHIESKDVSGSNLWRLNYCSRLSFLCLRSTNVSDNAVRQLNPQKSLRSIDLSFTQVTDDATQHLARFPAIETIALDGTDVTGQAIANLLAIRTLKRISVTQTAVTIQNLRAIVPINGTSVPNVAYTDMYGRNRTWIYGIVE